MRYIKKKAIILFIMTALVLVNAGFVIAAAPLSPAIELLAGDNSYLVECDEKIEFKKWLFDRATKTYCYSITVLELPKNGVLLLNSKPVIKGQILSRRELGDLDYICVKRTDDCFVFGSMSGELGIITKLNIQNI